MWVVFWTVRGSDHGIFYDTYNVVEDETTARRLLDEVAERDSTYAAGMGPITYSTEHWHDSTQH